MSRQRRKRPLRRAECMLDPGAEMKMDKIDHRVSAMGGVLVTTMKGNARPLRIHLNIHWQWHESLGSLRLCTASSRRLLLVAVAVA
jgi:hypothetical protein